MGKELDQGFVVGQRCGAQLGDEWFRHRGVLPDTALVPAVINMPVSITARRSYNGAMLRIEEKQARLEVLRNLGVILEILFVGCRPNGHGRMVAHVADVRIVERRGAPRKID